MSHSRSIRIYRGARCYLRRVTGRGARGTGLTACLRILIAILAARRMLMLGAALLPRREQPDHHETPSVTILVPVFNEGNGIRDLLAALEALDYPRNRLHTVLVDDGSTDGSDDMVSDWAVGRPRVTAIRLGQRSGRPAALNAGRPAVASDLVLVCDADLRPRPDLLRALSGHFTDHSVGAVGAYVAPTNADASPAATYASLEAWVHQLITAAGRDRLRLDPPVHACVAYRTTALESIGWFAGSEPGDDVRASLALSRTGWRTRFSRDAVAENTVASTWGEYWHQHVRWARNLLRARPPRHVPARLPGDRAPWRMARGAERVLTSAGYADRLVLAGALLLAARGRIPRRLAALYPTVIAVEVIAATGKAGRARRAPAYLALALAGSGIDLLATGAAIGKELLRRPHRWADERGWGPEGSAEQAPAREIAPLP